MECPTCKLENPPTALVCDCGHRFPGPGGTRFANPEGVYRSTDLAGENVGLHLQSISESLKSIRNMMLFWIVASVAAGVIWGLVVTYGALKQDEAVRSLQEQIQKRVPSNSR